LSITSWLLHLRGVLHSLMRGLCTCSAVYSVVKGQRKKSSFLTAMTKTGDSSCLYCDLFEKNILPCPFIEAADSASSLQAQ